MGSDGCLLFEFWSFVWFIVYVFWIYFWLYFCFDYFWISFKLYYWGEGIKTSSISSEISAYIWLLLSLGLNYFFTFIYFDDSLFWAYLASFSWITLFNIFYKVFLALNFKPFIVYTSLLLLNIGSNPGKGVLLSSLILISSIEIEFFRGCFSSMF